MSGSSAASCACGRLIRDIDPILRSKAQPQDCAPSTGYADSRFMRRALGCSPELLFYGGMARLELQSRRSA